VCDDESLFVDVEATGLEETCTPVWACSCVCVCAWRRLGGLGSIGGEGAEGAEGALIITRTDTHNKSKFICRQKIRNKKHKRTQE